MERTVRNLGVPIKPIRPDTSCAEVFDRLMADIDLLHVPVVQMNRPLGLINRQAFLLIYAAPFGREIYGRKPIARLMDAEPLIVDADMACEQVNRLLIAQDRPSSFQGFVIVDGDRYLSVGVVSALMKELADINRERAEELDIQRSRAETANHSKTQFLANMSHELRTPLNAIIGFADVIRGGTFGTVQPDRYAEYIEDIHSSGHHLLRLINEILDMAKIEAGRVEIKDTLVHPHELGDKVTRMLRQSAAAVGIRLNADIPDNGLPAVRADEQQLCQILLNLLSNAIKFTESDGEVRLFIRLRADGSFAFVVEDTGIGIPLEKLDKVIEPFEQVENSFSRSRSGTGLGLPLAKAMAEAHGGRLELKSQLGIGTRVSIILPPERVMTLSQAEVPVLSTMKASTG